MENTEPRAEHHNSSRDFWLKVMLSVGVLLICVVALTPYLMEQTKKVAITKATSHTKLLYYLMLDFDSEYGEFPNDRTAARDTKLNGYSGEYSNDYLGQFVAASYIDSEVIFYAKGPYNRGSKPDNVISPKEEILKEGECGFAYNKGYSTASNSGIPLLMSPMYGDGYKFDPYLFDNKGVVLRIDGSVKQLKLNDDRHAILPNFQRFNETASDAPTLFQTGPDSVWGEQRHDPSNLVYAKYPYDPELREHVRHKNMMSALVIGIALVIISLTFLIYRRRAMALLKESKKKQ